VGQQLGVAGGGAVLQGRLLQLQLLQWLQLLLLMHLQRVAVASLERAAWVLLAWLALHLQQQLLLPLLQRCPSPPRGHPPTLPLPLLLAPLPPRRHWTRTFLPWRRPSLACAWAWTQRCAAPPAQRPSLPRRCAMGGHGVLPLSTL
jgi:hypothetical protein